MEGGVLYPQVTYDQLIVWIGQFIWPLFRVSAFFAVAPFFGENSIPAQAKIGLAFFVGLSCAAMVGPVPAVDLASTAAFGMAIEQIIVGLVLGLTLRFLFASLILAGELIGLQMGLSMAQIYDPGSGGNVSSISKLLTAIAILVFISVNGHLLVITGLAKTFTMIPVGGLRIAVSGIGELLVWSEQVFTTGVLLAMPIIIALLMINLIMGVMNRAAQQLSIFSIGFPVTLGAGLIILTILLPRIDSFLEGAFIQSYEAMGRVAHGLSGRP